MRGGGLLVVKLTQQKAQPQNLEIVSPIDEPSMTAWSGGESDFRSSGNGTESKPYLIASPENLAYLSNHCNLFSGCYFRQTANLDMGGSSHPWTPINVNSTQYDYYYNGDNHTINNLYINLTDKETGLFGFINHGYIKNLEILSGSSITQTSTSTSYATAAFIGKAYGNILCENLINRAAVSGYQNVAGIIGFCNRQSCKAILKNCQNYGNISCGRNSCGGMVGITYHSVLFENCYNSGVIYTASEFCGGIIGRGERGNLVVKNCQNVGAVSTGSGSKAGGMVGFRDNANNVDETTIINCLNSGNITAKTNSAGGIIAYVGGYYCTVKDCKNSGNIKATDACVGGMCGRSYTNVLIENCSNIGEVKSTSSWGVGGICGVNGENNTTATIKNCFNTGQVSGGDHGVGGIIGRSLYISTVDNCYNTGKIFNGSYDIGGIVGKAENISVTIKNCYNTAEVNSGKGTQGGIIGIIYAKNVTIEKCYNTGYVHGEGPCGGIVGSARAYSTFVLNCYNLGEIESVNGDAGGIVGAIQANSNTPTVAASNCFNVSAITATRYGGGIVGSTAGFDLKLKSCYCTHANLRGSTGGQYIESDCQASVADANMKCGDGTKPTAFADSYTSGDWLFVSGQYPTFKKVVAIPDITPQFTYCGREIAPVISYDSNYLTLSSTTTKATNAGTYSFTLTLKNATTSVWEDGSTAAKTFSWTIDRATIDESLLPTQSGSLNYTGNSQNVSWSVFDSTKITAGGTTSATNAGTYKATFTPTANYKWADGSTEGKTVEWTINKQTLTNPSLNQPNNEFTFTGTTQDATTKLQNYQSDKMVQSGVTSALRAGTYVFVVSLKPEYQNNYIFANGQNFVIISWTILPYNIENATIVVGGN